MTWFQFADSFTQQILYTWKQTKGSNKLHDIIFLKGQFYFERVSACFSVFTYIILKLLKPCNSAISTSNITHLSPSYYLPYNVLRITRCGLVDGIPGFTQAAWVRFQASELFDSFKLFPAITLQRWNSPDKVCFENCHLVSEKVNCMIKETMWVVVCLF